MTDHANFGRSAQTSSLRPDLVLLALTGAGFVLAVALAYKHDFVFACRDSLPVVFCAGLSGAVPRALSVGGLLVLAMMLRPSLYQDAIAALRPVPALAGLAGAAVGCALIFLPWLLNRLDTGATAPLVFVGLWLSGLAVLGGGLAHALFPQRALAAAISPAALPVLGLVVFGLVLPEIATALQPVWRMPWLTDFTFNAVISLLEMLGQNVVSIHQIKMIGIDTFAVLVGPQCSGVEGLALITVFLSTYVFLFRDQLHLGRSMLLFPLALLASWTLNTVRIAALLLIGRHVSPDLAVEGFHSHAGWLMFMTLSIGFAAGAHRVHWFHKAPAAAAAVARPRPPFFSDPATALILPFAAFMASSTLVSAISATPALLYPLRMGVVALLLALSFPVIRALPWRIDPLSLGLGALCGVLWVATAPPAAAGDVALAARLEALPALLLALWVAIRLIGTALVVPLVEELFFRGYVLARLDRGGMAWRLVALLVSTALFAAMHDRYVAAALAGGLFGLVYLRRGNLTDAVVSHAAANAVIAGWALMQGDFSVI